MGMFKWGKSILRPFDGVAFDTPENHLRFAGQSGWVTFYTAVKMAVAFFLFTVFCFEEVRGFAGPGNEYFRWPDLAMQLLIGLTVIIVFLVLERTVFSGFRAYLDAYKRAALLEENLSASTKRPLYLPVLVSEQEVPASRSRFQLLLFVWSKYLLFLLYSLAVACSVFIYFVAGLEVTLPFLIQATLYGPVVIFFLGRWVLQSEKEIRLSFAKNGTLETEFQALQKRNTELEANMSGFTGKNEERDAGWQSQLQAKDETIRQKEAHLSEADRRFEALEGELSEAKASLQGRDQALAEGQAHLKDTSSAHTALQRQYDQVAKRLADVSTEFAKNCTLEEAFSSVKQTLARQGKSETLDADSLSVLAELMREIREKSPDGFSDAKSLSFISAEEQRINQYDAIVRLYSRKIQKLRSSELDEEEQQDAIDAMRRLRDREIAELEGAS